MPSLLTKSQRKVRRSVLLQQPQVKWIHVVDNSNAANAGPSLPVVKRHLVRMNNSMALDDLKDELTSTLTPSWGRVRNLYTPAGGTVVRSLDQLQSEKVYVVGGNKFKPLKALKKITGNNNKNVDEARNAAKVGGWRPKGILMKRNAQLPKLNRAANGSTGSKRSSNGGQRKGSNNSKNNNKDNNKEISFKKAEGKVDEREGDRRKSEVSGSNRLEDNKEDDDKNKEEEHKSSDDNKEDDTRSNNDDNNDDNDQKEEETNDQFAESESDPRRSSSATSRKTSTSRKNSNVSESNNETSENSSSSSETESSSDESESSSHSSSSRASSTRRRSMSKSGLSRVSERTEETSFKPNASMVSSARSVTRKIEGQGNGQDNLSGAINNKNNIERRGAPAYYRARDESSSSDLSPLSSSPVVDLDSDPSGRFRSKTSLLRAEIVLDSSQTLTSTNNERDDFESPKTTTYKRVNTYPL